MKGLVGRYSREPEIMILSCSSSWPAVWGFPGTYEQTLRPGRRLLSSSTGAWDGLTARDDVVWIEVELLTLELELCILVVVRFVVVELGSRLRVMKLELAGRAV